MTEADNGSHPETPRVPTVVFEDEVSFTGVRRPDRMSSRQLYQVDLAGNGKLSGVRLEFRDDSVFDALGEKLARSRRRGERLVLTITGERPAEDTGARNAAREGIRSEYQKSMEASIRLGTRISEEILGELDDEVRIRDAFPHGHIINVYYFEDSLADPAWKKFWQKTEGSDRVRIATAFNPLIRTALGQPPGENFAGTLHNIGRLETMGDLRKLTEHQLKRLQGIGERSAALIHAAVRRTEPG